MSCPVTVGQHSPSLTVPHLSACPASLQVDAYQHLHHGSEAWFNRFLSGVCELITLQVQLAYEKDALTEHQNDEC